MNDDYSKVRTEATRSSADGRRPVRMAVIVSTVIAVLGGGAAAWYGWSWWSAANDGSLSYARTRDDVLRIGQQAIANFNTLDSGHADEGLKRWEASATGSLLDEITNNYASYVQRAQDAKMVSTAKILDGAVTELDLHAGKAMVIAAVDITVTPAGGQAVDKRNRFQGELTRTTAGWKLSNISAVAVSPAGP